ncbi:MAG: SDR family oxidoreductase, partial [Agromyces sp.]
MTRYLVTGAGGMLGHDVLTALAGREVRALTHAELDITDADAVRALVQPGDVIMNCAAFNAVDAAESDPAPAFAINRDGPGVLARAAHAVQGRLVHISSDYVFDGLVREPHR